MSLLNKETIRHQYPENLVDRCRYLEKVKRNLHEEIRLDKEYIDRIETENKTLREYAKRVDGDEDHCVWIWIGDGYDLTRSMLNDTPILIRADDLKYLMEHGETVAEKDEL